MKISNFTSREFTQHVAAARKAASADDLVYILDQGKPAHVLMSIEQFRKISASKQNILEMLAMPEAAKIDWDIERARDLPRPLDLS